MAEEMKPDQKLVSLAECPIGMFLSDAGELCLKTEYGNNEGRIDAYIVSSGEFFWGGPMNVTAQRSVLVEPVDVYTAAQLAAAYAEALEDAAKVADVGADGSTNTYGHGRASAANDIRALPNKYEVK